MILFLLLRKKMRLRVIIFKISEAFFCPANNHELDHLIRNSLEMIDYVRNKLLSGVKFSHKI